MTFIRLRKSRLGISTIAITLVAYTLVLFAPRAAWAADVPPPTMYESNGQSTIGSGAAPSANSNEALATVELSTGAAETTYPFVLPTARGQAQPSLSLSYNSQNGLGPAGVGWALDLPSIVRKGKSGLPRFQDTVFQPGYASDVLTDDYYIDGQLLLPIQLNPSHPGWLPSTSGASGGPPTAYGWVLFRREQDDGARYYFDGQTWMMQTKAGNVLEFGVPLDGGTPGTEVAEGITAAALTGVPVGSTANNANPIYRWNLVRNIDVAGNTVYYIWDDVRTLFRTAAPYYVTNGAQRLTDIYDTSSVAPTPLFNVPNVAVPAASTFAHHIQLTWALTSVAVAAIGSGGPVGPLWRALPIAQLTTVDVTSATFGSTTRKLTREYQLSYHYNNSQTRAYLTSIQEIGNCYASTSNLGIQDGAITSTAVANCAKWPATTYAYYGIQASAGATVPAPMIQNKAGSFQNNGTLEMMADVNGDGLADALMVAESGACQETLNVSGNSYSDAASVYLQLGGQGTASIVTSIAGVWGAEANGCPWQTQLNMFALGTLADWNSEGIQTLSVLSPNGGTHFGYYLKPGLPQAFRNPGGYVLFSASGALFGQHSFDVDGDGWPDLPFWSASGPGFNTAPVVVTTYLSSVDRNNQLHQYGFTSSATAPDNQATYEAAAGTLLGTAISGNGNNGQASALPTSIVANMQFADMDGDGVQDIVLFGGNTGAIGANVLLGRGDGRFGGTGTNQFLASPAGEVQPYSDNTFGYSSYALTTTNAGGTGVGDTTQALRLGDLDHDGLADLAVLNSTGLTVCLQTVVGFKCAMKDTSMKRLAPDSHGRAADIEIGDLDGSGFTRLVYFPMPGGSSTLATSMQVNNAPSGTSLGELGLLQSISNGVGAKTTLTYASVHAATTVTNNSTFPLARTVVATAATTNDVTSILGSQGQLLQKTYTYDTPLFDPIDRQFAGFKSVTETGNSDGTGSLGTVVKTTFGTTVGAPPTGAPAGAYFSRATRGKVAVVEITENSATLPAVKFKTITNQYTFQSPYTALDGRFGLGVAKAFQQTELWDESAQGGFTGVSQTFAFDGTTISGPVVTTSYNTVGSSGLLLARENYFDINGNLTVAKDVGRLFDGDLSIETVNTWNTPQNDWSAGWSWRIMKSQTGYAAILPGEPSSFLPNQPGPGGSVGTVPQVLREYNYFYESSGRLVQTYAPLTRPAGATLTFNPAVLSSRPVPAPCGSNDGCTTPTDYLLLQGYDAYGNVNQIGNQQNPTETTFVYDTAFNQLPKDIVVNSPQGPLDTSISYDRGSGLRTSTMTPDGQMTVYDYDDFGRILEIDAQSPGALSSTQKQVTVAYNDVGPIRNVHVENADGLASNAGAPVPGAFVKHDLYIDGFGETRAQVDQIAATAAEGTNYLLSGVHSSYLNGRAHAIYQPTPYTAATVSAGAFPAGVITPASTASATVTQYDGLGRARQGTDFNGKSWKSVPHLAQLSVDTYDQIQFSGTTHYTTTVMDGHGRTVSVTKHAASSSGSDIVTTYDSYLATGEPLSITNGGVTRTLTYDSLGHMATNTEANSGTWRYAYDFAGRLVGTSDARGCGQNIYYDGIGRMTARDLVPCVPSGFQSWGQSQPAYTAPDVDSVGNPTGNGTEAFYTYNVLGQLADVKDVARHDAIAYDPRGRINTIARSIVAATWPTNNYGSPASNGGDIRGAAVLANRYASNVFTKTVGYDFQDRMLTATTGATASQITSMGTTETRTYSFDGRIQSVKLTGGTTAETLVKSHAATYSNNGTVSRTQTFGDASSATAVTGYGADGLLGSYHLSRAGTPPWATVTPAESDSDTANLYRQKDLLNLTFKRDAVGNPTSVNDTSTSTWPGGAGAVSQSFTYGNDYRLKSATSCKATTCPATGGSNEKFVSPTQNDTAVSGPAYLSPFESAGVATRFKSDTFSYDVRGNVTSSSDDSNLIWDRSLGAVSYGAVPPPVPTVFGPDQISSTALATPPPGTNPDGIPNWSNIQVTVMDASGNTLIVDLNEAAGSGNGDMFAYDELGRMVFGQSYQPEWMVYADDGDRVLSFHQLESTGYNVYVFDSLVLHNATYASSTYQDDATTEQVYVGGSLGRVFYDSGNVLPKVANNQTHLFMSLGDGRGSVGVVLDHDSGEVVERLGYQPYGNLDDDYRPQRWGYNYERHKFGGHWDNEEIGVVNMGARYYSPQLGRFISPDPLWIHGLVGDPNPYEYANGNPIRYGDSTGLDPSSNGTFQGGIDYGDGWSYSGGGYTDSKGVTYMGTATYRPSGPPPGYMSPEAAASLNSAPSAPDPAPVPGGPSGPNATDLSNAGAAIATAADIANRSALAGEYAAANGILPFVVRPAINAYTGPGAKLLTKIAGSVPTGPITSVPNGAATAFKNAGVGLGLVATALSWGDYTDAKWRGDVGGQIASGADTLVSAVGTVAAVVDVPAVGAFAGGWAAGGLIDKYVVDNVAPLRAAQMGVGGFIVWAAGIPVDHGAQH